MRTFAAKEERDKDDGGLCAWLDVHLDRRPITGRLRTANGVEELFFGWLGFLDALKRGAADIQATSITPTARSLDLTLRQKTESGRRS